MFSSVEAAFYRSLLLFLKKYFQLFFSMFTRISAIFTKVLTFFFT